MRRTDQCSNGKTCGNTGDRTGADIACNAADGREGAEDKGDVFVDLERCVSYILGGEGRGTRATMERDLEAFLRSSRGRAMERLYSPLCRLYFCDRDLDL